MAGAIALNILSNVREAVRGAESLADATEGVSERMRDLTQEGSSSSGRMEGDFRKMSAAGSKASEELKAKFRAAYLEVFSGSSEAAQGMTKLVDAGKRAGKTNEEVAKDISKAYKISLADATKAVDKLDSALDDAARAAQRSGSDSKAALRDIEQAAKKAESAVDDIGNGSGQIGKKLKSGLDEAKSEAASSGREAAASFSGGFDDVADFVQETIANALGGFGPAGAAAGIAVAAVIGTVLADAAQAQEKLEEARSKAADLANTMYDNGGEIPLTDRVSELIELLSSERLARNPFESLANDFVDLGTNMDMVKDAARNLDAPLNDIIEAMTGSDLRKTEVALRLARVELEKINKESGNVNTEDWQRRKDSVAGLVSELQNVLKQGEFANELYNSTEFLNAERIDEQAARVSAATESLRQEQEAAYDSMRDAAYEKATADDAAFDLDKWLTYVEETRAQADAYKANLEAMRLDPDQLANLLSLPDDARTTIVSSYAQAGEDGRSRIIAALGDGGAGEAGTRASGAFKDAFKPEAEVIATVDTDAAEAKVQELIEKRKVVVEVVPDTTAWDNLVLEPKVGKIRTSVDKAPWNDWEPSRKAGWVKAQPLG